MKIRYARYPFFLEMRFNSFAVLIWLISIFISGCSPNIKNLDSPGHNIICFGDSITYGAGASDGEDYPTYLSSLLGREVINAGASGDTTYDALERLKKDVLENDPYIVIVELGGNDFLQKMPRDETMQNLKEIISRIQAANAIVVLCDLSSGIFLSGYRNDYRKLAKETGCVFIPRLLDGILTSPLLRSDEIHPNAQGYKIIAEKICKAIKSYIK